MTYWNGGYCYEEPRDPPILSEKERAEKRGWDELEFKLKMADIEKSCMEEACVKDPQKHNGWKITCSRTGYRCDLTSNGIKISYFENGKFYDWYFSFQGNNSSGKMTNDSRPRNDGTYKIAPNSVKYDKVKRTMNITFEGEYVY